MKSFCPYANAFRALNGYSGLVLKISTLYLMLAAEAALPRAESGCFTLEKPKIDHLHAMNIEPIDAPVATAILPA